MPELSNLLIFLTAGIALVLSPGPAVLFIVARSLEQGSKAGIISTLGIASGTTIHILFASLGLSAILMQSALAFNVIKYLGALYLIYLGIRSFMSSVEDNPVKKIIPKSYKKIYAEGFVVNLLNPKTALFFFAFLPQFVKPSGGNITIQILFLGSLFTVLAMISDSCYALAAGKVKNVLSGNQMAAKFQKYFSGTIYIALGIATAFSGNGRNK